MAEEIRTNGSTNIYSRMLDRFAVPTYNAELTAEFNRIYHFGDDANAEKVYEKRYWTWASERGKGSGNNDEEKSFITYVNPLTETEHKAQDKAALFYDPGWNAYNPGVNSSTKKENDMAAMFAPSDEALRAYFTHGEGEALIERYGRNVPDKFGTGLEQAIDSIPLDDLQHLLRNMMKNSFNAAVPSRFASIMDDARDPMGVTKDHLEKCIIANNGVIYVTNKVYSPARYVAVTAPVMLSDTLKIADWAINKYEYDKYLLSMGSTFSLVVPSDGCMKYLDPSSLKTGSDPTMYVFKWNEKNSNVYAETWLCDPITLDTIPGGKKDNLTSSSQIENLLKQMYEYYIVVGDFTDGNKYHMTKGYGTIKVDVEGDEVKHIYGGYQVQNDQAIAIGHTYHQKNGNTYRLDEGMIQPPTQSVYKVLSDSINRPEFSKFYELCLGSDKVLEIIAPVDNKGAVIQDSINKYKTFITPKGATCLDYNVRTFNTYHYTVYVPTNAALDEAYAMGLPNWLEMEDEAFAIDELRIQIAELTDSLDAMTEETPAEEKEALMAELSAKKSNDSIRTRELKRDAELLSKFVQYHFQDNSVYVDNLPHFVMEGETKKTVVDYETSTLDELTKRFCVLTVETQDHAYGATISVKGDITGMDNTCYVVNAPGTEGQLYNIMTRDIEFSGKTINTSSFAVVHQIEAAGSGFGFLVNDRIYNVEKGEFIR